MAKDVRVNYGIVRLSGRSYRCLHVVLVTLLLVAAVAFFVLGRTSDVWLIRQAWWILGVTAILDVSEAWVALRLAQPSSRVGGDERP